MTRTMHLWGIFSVATVITVLSYVILTETDRQETAAAKIQAQAVTAATDLYAENCVSCHGASGEGILSTPPLNSDALRAMDEESILKTIARGRYGTTMAAWSVDEGGVLSSSAVTQLVTFIYYADWEAVSARVAALGLTPPEPVVVEISPETMTQIQALPDGVSLANGLTLYTENCVACHSTAIAPTLNSEDLRSRLTDDDLTRIIREGVAGTLMAGWSNILSETEVTDLVNLIRNYPVLETAGITLPTAPPPIEVEMTPEVIAEGGRLFGILCVQCHGVNGYGTQIAPALNAQPFLDDTPDSALAQIIANGVPGTKMPAWGGYLSESDVLAITAYIRSWAPTAPPTVGN